MYSLYARKTIAARNSKLKTALNAPITAGEAALLSPRSPDSGIGGHAGGGGEGGGGDGGGNGGGGPGGGLGGGNGGGGDGNGGEGAGGGGFGCG